ncbi:TetR/AcrR family transcriptional regulator [Streptomyces parvulus]|uniref:TetR/AcrR family transcriptional regulator n=1 Tax=Streptomyces parvulus TaxID=146923 RepID=A0A369UWL1_9ACTN|nr:TetR/AcrR family transcriptional regulator [Streptomyces parvulus]RDD85136.1 TetR/AcrR family transcriptional regulator [Streptomyces parvulus]
MGRPRSFDETAVLDAAAAEFRVHGLADTSTEQLCKAAGVRRSSLYNAFTSKDELFVRALERYASVFRERRAQVAADDRLSGAERLRALIEGVVEEERAAREQGHAAGCMFVQTRMTPGLRERDERVARLLDQDQRELLEGFEAVIRAGRMDGSIREDADPREGALLVATVISGLRVTAQAGVEYGMLRQIALSGLHSLLA